MDDLLKLCYGKVPLLSPSTTATGPCFIFRVKNEVKATYPFTVDAWDEGIEEVLTYCESLGDQFDAKDFKQAGKLKPWKKSVLDAAKNNPAAEVLIRSGVFCFLCRDHLDRLKSLLPKRHIEVLERGKPSPVVASSALAPGEPDHYANSDERTRQHQSTPPPEILSNIMALRGLPDGVLLEAYMLLADIVKLTIIRFFQNIPHRGCLLSRTSFR